MQLLVFVFLCEVRGKETVAKQKRGRVEDKQRQKHRQTDRQIGDVKDKAW